MYNLLVSHQFSERTEGTFEFSRGRVLEYTNDSIAAQLRSLSVEAIESLQSWPCILMEEGRGQEQAYIGCITAVQDSGADINLSIVPYSIEPVILNDDIWKTRANLDIEQFEFSRYHWAIKDRDLFKILHSAGHRIDSSVMELFEDKPLPAPSRADLISAKIAIAEWSHTAIDDFLLEVGVDDLAADRNIGSRRDRANVIGKFVIENPGATTAENSLFSSFMVRAASISAHDIELQPESNSTSLSKVATLPEPAVEEAPGRSPNRVFVVHGQSESARSAIVSFLSSVGLEGIVLHEQPNMGQHLLTKFIKEAELATFAIVLMTDDDVGGLKGSRLTPRARQNVILELGYFLSHLGQARVCALITPGLETPSDFDGIVYIRMDDDGSWEAELTRELLAAGMPMVGAPSSADHF